MSTAVNSKKYKLRIEYCTAWNYTPRAVSLTDELTKNYTPSIESLTLLPSRGGVFEVMADDMVIFSKKAVDRHAEPGEVARLFEEKMGVKPQPRQ